MLTAEDARKFAIQWIQHWNDRELEALVAHYAKRVKFVSPLVSQICGQPVIETREELHDYWREALRRRKSRTFHLDYVIWDEAQQRLAIAYWNSGDSGAHRAAELFDFDNEGKVMRGEALYGALDESTTLDFGVEHNL